jgi:flagellar hook-basal body complex protein FliE
MNPLDALSGLTGNLGSVNLPVTPTTPAMPGAPVGENVTQMLGGIQPAGSVPALDPTAAAGGSPSTWGHMAQQMVLDVSNQQQNAAAKVNDVLRGGPTPVHEAMIATEEAGLSFEFLAQVRNKLVDAYQQVMQMQV